MRARTGPSRLTLAILFAAVVPVVAVLGSSPAAVARTPDLALADASAPSPRSAAPSPSGSGAAGADDDAPTPTGGPAAAPPAAEPAPRRLVPSLSHDLQFGLAVLIGDGFRAIAPYDDNIPCGDAKNLQARVCTTRTPVFIDLQPSFGISQAWDFIVDLRFGLERERFSAYRQFVAAPGFRYWLDPQTPVKFFSTIQLWYDRTSQNANSRIGTTDLGIRNSNGLMLEVMRNFGVYFQFGETIGLVRWASFSVDGGVGVQARLP